MIKPINQPFDLPPEPDDAELDDAETAAGDPAVRFDPGEFEIEEIAAEFHASSPEVYDFRPECEAFFAPGGPLKQAAEHGGRPYEFRPQQLEMAGAIADALAQGDNLCVEAPTGVGKSFAYLVPLILRSRIASRPALISTETINLQEQLIEKDIPLLKQLTGVEFRAALAKGRRNYLCRRRFSLATGEQRDALIPSPALAMEVDRLALWLERTRDGGRHSIDFRIDPATWNLVCCEALNCLGPKCPFFRTCFYFKARQEWETADLVVANHALFFTDLAMRCVSGAAGSLLPNYGVVLIDEAHTLENNAAEHLGLHLSRAGIVSVLNRLYNHDNARGLLMRKGESTLDLRAAVTAVRDETYGFFSPYEEFLNKREESAAKIPEARRFPDRLSPKLRELHQKLAEYVEELEDASVRTEFESQLTQCREFVSGIEQFNGQLIPESVYYAEADRNSVTLKASPLNVAELLAELLFSQDFPVVLCSATLTVRRSFDYFVSRTGYCNGGTLLLDSPFGAEQARLLVPRNMPDPAGDTAEFERAVINEIPRFLELSDGKAFVLFTSYRLLRNTANFLRDFCYRHGWQLLVQGESLNRSSMLREFKADGHAVLFGTDSFWTGVDVPGEALSNVILTKLPFASPGHPLTAAREDRIRERGGSPFFEYDLPEAVLKFRQGVGRLIRSRTDRGIIVLLDRRVLTKRYGRMFLESVPYRCELVE